MTKKDIYQQYGIEYKGGKILSPFGFIAPLMPVGSNSKVGDAATWSIYHGNEIKHISSFGAKTQNVMKAASVTEIKGSCPMHCKGCYCDNGNYNFDSVKSFNIMKLLIAQQHLDFMVRAIKAQIAADHITQVRIHASGDFFSNAYVDAWKDIANSCPTVIFWTYTKNPAALKAFAEVQNVSIVPSITPHGLNFGTCAELLEHREKLIKEGKKVHICACGTEYEKHCSDCSTGCKAIGTKCDYVLFIKHSTADYKCGQKDAKEYKAICEIIAKQDN